MCPPGGHPIPSADVCLWSSHSIPQTPPLFMYMKQRRGGWGVGGVVSVFHHRDKACPHSSSISSKPTPSRRSVWRARASRSPQNRCPVFGRRRLSTSFSSFYCSLCGTDAPKNNSRGKKTPPPAAVRGCVPYAFICDVFDVRSTEVTERGGGQLCRTEIRPT